MGGAMHQVPVVVWLASIGLSEYAPLFKAYTNVGSLLALSERDLRNLGLKDSTHRTRLYSTLALLNERSAKPPVRRHSHSHSLSRSSSVESNSESLQTCSWFHGPLTYQRAESLLRKNGDFLLRESVSKSDTYVLSCRWRNECLHIVISASPGKGGTTDYGFDGDVYSTVPALITAHVGERKPVTASTGAIVSFPVHRSGPLPSGSLINTSGPVTPKPVLTKSLTTSALGGDNSKPSHFPMPSGESSLRAKPPLVPLKKTISNQDSLSATNLLLDPGLGAGQVAANGRVVAHPLCRSSSMDVGGIGKSASATEGLASGTHSGQRGGRQGLMMAGSEPNLLDTVEEQPDKNSGVCSDTEGAPPKPSRVPTVKRKDGNRPTVKVRNQELYKDDGRDYSELDQVMKTPTININDLEPEKSAASQKPRKKLKSSAALSRHKRSSPRSPDDKDDAVATVTRTPSLTYDEPSSRPVVASFVQPPADPSPILDLDGFTTPLLPHGNKALFPESLASIKALLAQSDYKILAKHLSLVDYDMLKVTGTKDLGAGVTNGPEMMSLPQGSSFRDAVVERHHSMVFFVAVTIVMMNVTEERAFMLKRWILIAAELIRNHGNLMSFYAIVEGILHPTVDRLSDTWAALTKSDRQVVDIFRSKMAPTYKALFSCTSGLPVGDLSLPNLLPLAQLLDRDDQGGLSGTPIKGGSSPNSAKPTATRALSWETSAHRGSGLIANLDLLLVHLDTARLIGDQAPVYRVKALGVIHSLPSKKEPLLTDLFRVEMHMRLLFGWYGCRAPRELRWDKFRHILAILSNKIEMHGAGTEL